MDRTALKRSSTKKPIPANEIRHSSGLDTVLLSQNYINFRPHFARITMNSRELSKVYDTLIVISSDKRNGCSG